MLHLSVLRLLCVTLLRIALTSDVGDALRNEDVDTSQSDNARALHGSSSKTFPECSSYNEARCKDMVSSRGDRCHWHASLNCIPVFKRSNMTAAEKIKRVHLLMKGSDPKLGAGILANAMHDPKGKVGIEYRTSVKPTSLIRPGEPGAVYFDSQCLNLIDTDPSVTRIIAGAPNDLRSPTSTSAPLDYGDNFFLSTGEVWK